MQVDQLKIAIIGGGNLGKAILSGFLQSGYNPSLLTITRRRIDLLKEFKGQGVHVESNNSIAVAGSDVIILAIKPYQAEDLLKELGPDWKTGQIVVSLMTGIDILRLKEMLPKGISVYRVMPNTAVAINESMTLIATHEKNEQNIQTIHLLFEKLGQVLLIEEELMAAATVLGACGIAFALRFLRAAMQGGVEIGFSAEVAQQIVSQTVKGATELILQTGHHPEQEIDKVTTPKGITISGLNEMEHQGFSSALIRGLLVSYNKLSGNK